MDVDDEIRQSLQLLGGSLQPDVNADRRALAARVARHRRRTGLVVVALTACLVLLVSTAAALVAGPLGHQHASPPASPSELPNPFVVRKTLARSALALTQPLSLAVAPDGTFYVTDAAQTVTQYAPDGRLLRRWGRAGTGPGEFRLVSGGIAVDPRGRVYVADTGNFRVQVFTADGRFLRQYGSFGTGPGQFLYPSDVAAAGDGSLYVTDDHTAKVTRLRPDGTQVWRHGADNDDPRLVGHEHLSGFDPQGRLVMANDDAGLVLFLDPSGAVSDVLGNGEAGAHETGRHPARADFPNGACDATTDTRGYVYVNSCEDADQPHHNTEVFDAGHHLVGRWVAGPFALSPRFASGTGFALSSTGDVLEVSVSTETAKAP
jgi:sugar lactone lactonase YvrE